MSKEHNRSQHGAVRNSGRRRDILRGIATGAISSIGLSGSVSATESRNPKHSDTTVESVDFSIASAKDTLEEITSSKLFESLVTDGYFTESSIEAIPFEELIDESLPGGIERLRVNGDIEQYNYHIPLDGNRLEIMLPLSDFIPNAYLHKKDGAEIVYAPDNSYQGEELRASTASTEASSNECGPPYMRFCTSCIACCGLRGWSRNEKKVECSNCVIGNCKWVKTGCCKQ
ncbi:hypothetical protein [Natrinema halophilum]|uniref:Uncharacterized protein n=1 Tax=Natrinema halophilum TaxID=1699371 RepID=A0A7D5GTJ2_9EURY|nr:hypothetical protein [Natrinema halophilum]QLG50129.1 hypothetical protein HYG82_15335 [Natrinema halophilum]